MPAGFGQAAKSWFSRRTWIGAVPSLAAALVLLAPGGASAAYILDDGTAESTVGTANAAIYWLNAFQVLPGQDSITSLDIAFGGDTSMDIDLAFGVGPGDGTPVTAYLWGDPDNDGNPDDAFVLASVMGTIQNSNTNTFIRFTFDDPVNVGNIGEYFFAGFFVDQIGAGGDTGTTEGQNYAVGQDTTLPPAGRSWYSRFDFAPDPNRLGSGLQFGKSAEFGLDGNFLIRANSTADSVPEPSTWILMTSGLALAAWRRRKAR